MRLGSVTVLALALVVAERSGAQQAHRDAIGTADFADTIAPASARMQAGPGRPDRLVRVHRTLGTVALVSFGIALTNGAASGNLGKLMDSTACCPDGGTRQASARAFDRALVQVGIASYIGAAGIAGYRAATHASRANGHRKTVHKWLALAHGLAFTTSAVTGAMMGDAQESDPARFARLARVHVAANVAFLPLLAAAFTTMTVR